MNCRITHIFLLISFWFVCLFGDIYLFVAVNHNLKTTLTSRLLAREQKRSFL